MRIERDWSGASAEDGLDLRKRNWRVEVCWNPRLATQWRKPPGSVEQTQVDAPSLLRKEDGMISAIIERCAGIDVGKRFVVVCAMTGSANEVPQVEKAKFGVTSEELGRLRVWLLERNCTHVVMESTGSYWKPVFNVLEEGLKVVLANPVHVKNLRGHKTDLKDSEWLAHLLRHGMIRPSFIPPAEIRELRGLTRQRRDLVAEGARQRNRVQKLMAEGNIQLGNVLTDVFGASGQPMIEALVEGKATPEQIAELAKGAARRKIPEIQKAVEGHHLTESLRFLIKQDLRYMDFLEMEIGKLDEAIAERLRPFAHQVELLEQLPGVDRNSAATILGEIGVDMGKFPTGPQMASWAGLCPGNNQTGGFSKSGRTRPGNATLRATLNQCAWAAAHTKDTRIRNSYESLRSRRGAKKAVVAVAHHMILLIHTTLSTGVPYSDPNWHADTTRSKSRRVLYHKRRLEKLGCQVSISEEANIG